MNHKRILALLVTMAILLLGASQVTGQQDEIESPQGVYISAFTYQGQLKGPTGLVNGQCDLRFTLWDAVSGGNQAGWGWLVEGAEIVDGLFTARLDFGEGAFQGDERWLAIEVRCPAGAGDYTALSPRQTLTAAPYALALPGLWTQANTTSPNLIGGWSGNSVTAGVAGASIGGGGGSGWAQRVTDSFGTVSGGVNNRAGNDMGTASDASYATVGGGLGNTAQRESATIGGGSYNNVLGAYGTVAGGDHNHAYGQNSTVAGGGWNEVIGSGSYAFIGGGNQNSATASNATVAGGSYNSASASHGTVGGGWSNAASVQYATVGGGYDNTASNEYTTVGGGSTNTASHLDATVAGGSHNTASGARAAVGGGYGNTASGENATVGGGQWNTASAAFATIGGGGPSDPGSPETTHNRVTDMYGTVGGGGDNCAGLDDGDPDNQAYATVGGGKRNWAWGDAATVGGGWSNWADATYATVGGGNDNLANGWGATVGGGEGNTAIGGDATISGGANNYAGGHGAMVPGGVSNGAMGHYSFAAGFNAGAYSDGCFVWADPSGDEVPCNVDNRWVARASGGVWFYTNSTLSSGVYVSAGGTSWNSISDRATKENLIPVDVQALLETLASLPVQEYNLKSQDPAIRHIGLVAQDFAAFGYGESDLAINMQDADGVALAAIQGLYQQLQALEAENDELAARLAALEARQATGGSPVRLPSGWLLLGGGVLAVGAVAGRRAWGSGR